MRSEWRMKMLKKIFRNIKLFFARCFGASLPYVSEQKYYGTEGEWELSQRILEKIPSCVIKNNVIIQSKNGNAEIDCLVLLGSKLFAIEVKRWKGDLTEMDDFILQEKVDQWTDEIHTKQHKSPFKQLGRAIYLLRSEIRTNAWVNPIIFFEDADSIYIKSENVWFDDVVDLITYIELGGTSSPRESAHDLFEKCIASDCLYSNDGTSFLYGKILKHSLCFQTDEGQIKPSDILSIKIHHHLLYDELDIQLKDRTNRTIKVENEKIEIENNGIRFAYSLCKLDYIRLG